MYQAGSSEMFGAASPPQNEATAFYPRSPYAAAKVAAYWYCVNYREAYSLFISNGLLFNHESPLRGETFVTRKITRAVGKISMGLQKKLYLGNLEARRDWGFAGDYVDAMWRMMQHSEPDDFVIGTGTAHTLRDFLSEAFAHVNLDWKKFVRSDTQLMRLAEVERVVADNAKARSKLGWNPHTSFRDLVHMMVDHDLQLLKTQASAK
jgi:GDPmannose 4,6-dehydratase